MRPIKILAVLFLLAAAGFAQVMPRQDTAATPPQRAPEHTISVVVSATDSQGNPLRDLTKESVTVTENNQPLQTAQVQAASDLPLDLGIILLASKDKFDQEKAAAIELAQKVLRPGKDRAFVVTAAGDRPWPSPKLDWQTDSSAVADTIRGLDKNAGLPDLFNYVLNTDAVGTGRLSVQTFNKSSGFSFFNVVWAMMKSDPRPVRRAVVIFRLPMTHAPGAGEQSSRACEENHNTVIAAAQVLGVSLFTVGLDDAMPGTDTARKNMARMYVPQHNGNSVDSRQYDQDTDRFNELQFTAGRNNVIRIADETGGRAYWPAKKNYTDAVASIVNELSARYVVNFVPPDKSAASPIHPIKVQVAGAAHVSAPRAYIAQPPGQ
jgi:VWFA-related protein